MSHELRTPLNSMIGFNELLLEDNTLGQEQRAYSSTALSSARSLLSMLDNILEFSRLEGASTLDLHDFDLFDVLDHLVSSVRNRALQRGVDVVYSVDLGGISGRLIGDPQRLGQMLEHLLDNAIKSYPDRSLGSAGGDNNATCNTVQVRARFANKRRWNSKLGVGWTSVGHIKGDPANHTSIHVGTLDIEVEDQGRGIPAAKVGKLFTPFGQVESSDQVHGIGLGLAIVKRLADAMGGNVSCRSIEGVGSTFAVRNLTFPVRSRPPTPLPAAAHLVRPFSSSFSLGKRA
jgi:signal transduction histidine kinase